MKKSLLPVILALLIILTLPAMVCAYDYTAVVASQAAQQTAQQVTVNQTGHVPLKNLCQIIGASLTFNESTNTATVQYQEHTIIFTANSKQVTIDGKAMELKATVFIDNGSMTVPIEAFSSVFNYHLYYDGMALSYFVY